MDLGVQNGSGAIQWKPTRLLVDRGSALKLNIPGGFLNGTPGKRINITPSSSAPLDWLSLWIKGKDGYYSYASSANDSTLSYHESKPGRVDALIYGGTASGEQTNPWTFQMFFDNEFTTRTVEGIVPPTPPAPAPSTLLAFDDSEADLPAPPPATPVGQVGVDYDAQMMWSGDIVFVEAEGLPPGLGYDPETGEIGGIPTEPGTFEATFTAWTSADEAGISTHSIEILPVTGAPEFTNTPPAAVAGQAWTWTPTFAHGAETLIAEDLPLGLTLDFDTKTISGTFTLPGGFDVPLRAANLAGITAWETFTVNVQPNPGAPVIPAPAPVAVVAGQTVNHTPTVGAFGDFIEMEGEVPGTSWDPVNGTLIETPVATGAFSVQLRGENEHGPGPWVPWTVTVLEDFAPVFQGFADDAGLTAQDATATATPFNDGVSNLLKFAFNMDASRADNRVLVPGIGTAGLPAGSTEVNGATRTIRIEYLRRRFSTLTYTPKFSTTLAFFSAGTGTEISATPVDEFYERVIWEETVPASTERYFWTVEVSGIP